jgi:hypothetical protein
MGMGGGSPIPSPQSQALQQSTPEALLGMPGMLKGLGGAAVGGLAGLAKMAPQMAKAGRMPPPSGYSNVAPMGNSGGFNSSMAQAMLNSKGPLQTMGDFRRIPPWLRNTHTQDMMKQNPQRMQAQLGKEALAAERGPKFGPSGANPEAAMLEEMLARRRFGG